MKKLAMAVMCAVAVCLASCSGSASQANREAREDGYQGHASWEQAQADSAQKCKDAGYVAPKGADAAAKVPADQ